MLTMFLGWGSGFLELLTNPKKLLYIAGAVLAVYLSWQALAFVNTAIDNAALVAEQKITIQLLEGEVETQKFLTQQAERAAEIAETARIEAEEREVELDRIRDDALSAGDERDGELAPVLQDTLRALRP